MVDILRFFSQFEVYTRGHVEDAWCLPSYCDNRLTTRVNIRWNKMTVLYQS